MVIAFHHVNFKRKFHRFSSFWFFKPFGLCGLLTHAFDLAKFLAFPNHRCILSHSLFTLQRSGTTMMSFFWERAIWKGAVPPSAPGVCLGLMEGLDVSKLRAPKKMTVTFFIAFFSCKKANWQAKWHDGFHFGQKGFRFCPMFSFCSQWMCRNSHLGKFHAKCMNASNGRAESLQVLHFNPLEGIRLLWLTSPSFSIFSHQWCLMPNPLVSIIPTLVLVRRPRRRDIH